MLELKNHIAEKTHVIWDWNGTLLSDLDHAIDVVNRLLREERLSEITHDDYKKTFGFPVIDYYRRLGFDTSPEAFAELSNRFTNYFYEGLHTCDLWPGARELLNEVKALGKTQSLLSASEQTILLQSVKRFGVEVYFDHVFGLADNQAASKVARGLELMKTVGSDKAHTVLIGDTDHDLEVGEAMGIDVILVEHGHQCPTRLREVHHTVVRVL